MGKNNWQRLWHCGVILCFNFCIINSASATLGKSETLIQTRARSIGYLVSSPKAHKSGRVYELSSAQASSSSVHTAVPNNTNPAMNLKIKEFVSDSGIVYALGWSGSSQPDLSVLLGDYVEEFKNARIISPVQRYRLPFRRFESDRLTIQITRRGKFVRGYAYISDLKPSDVEAQDLQ